MDHAARLVEENRLFAEVVTGADPATPVPTCPDWTLAQLLRHVGRGDRWAATIVAERAEGYLDPRTVGGGRPPEGPGAVADWLAGGVTDLLDAVATDPQAPVWTFLGSRPASWWVRRRLHEVVAHRADAALATGVPFALDAATAADGVSEWLELVAARVAATGPDAPPVLAEGASLHLHATDEGLGEAGEWTVRREGSGITWEHGHAKGAVAVRAAAADLLLLLLRRLPAEDPRYAVFGDSAVLATWLARTPF